MFNTMKEVQNNRDYATALRRYFHQHPELSWKEFETAKKIREELTSYGIPWTAVAETGTIATLHGAADMPVIGLRCDIDALPIQEVKDLSYKSQNDGVMHACGHDSHITMLLTAAKILAEHRDELKCTVKFIFQPAEETMTNGAIKMLESGLVDDLDTVAGIHIFPYIQAGKISVEAGPRYTAAGFMRIKIKGVGGHGAWPNLAVDPIYVGSKVIDALQSITSRETDPNETVIVSVCTFHAGTLPNVIPETAELSGTVRTFNSELAAKLPETIERVIRNTTAAYRADYEFDYYTNIPATVNDARCSKIAEKSVRSILGDEGLTEYYKSPGGEDFAYFLNRFPGVYAFVGCRNEEKDCVYALHHDHFDLDEEGMLNGAAFYIQYLLDAQEEKWK